MQIHIAHIHTKHEHIYNTHSYTRAHTHTILFSHNGKSLRRRLSFVGEHIKETGLRFKSGPGDRREHVVFKRVHWAWQLTTSCNATSGGYK